jgi:hypothetical protein
MGGPKIKGAGTLIPDDGTQLGQTRFADWLKQPGAKAVAAAR